MNWRYILGTLMILLTGMILGFVMAHHYLMFRLQNFRQNGPQIFVPGIMRELELGLALRSDQLPKVREELMKTTKQVMEFHQGTVHPRVQKFFKEGLENIKSHLNERQVEELSHIGNPFIPKRPGLHGDGRSMHPPGPGGRPPHGPPPPHHPPPHYPPPHHPPPHHRPPHFRPPPHHPPPPHPGPGYGESRGEGAPSHRTPGDSQEELVKEVPNPVDYEKGLEFKEE